MNTIYKSILVIGLGIVSLAATAQKDSTLTRQVLLERDYNPTMQEASKINTMPSIYTPTVKAKEFKFVSSAPQLNISGNQLGKASSGDINTNVLFSKKRGYLDLGGGTHGNLEGAAGYRILNSATDHLDLFASHSSTNGEVDYINSKKYFIKDVKAKYAATNVNLKYQHFFEPSILSFNASFFNTAYNYYGNSFIPVGAADETTYDLTSKQNVDVLSFGAGLKSSLKNEGELKYDANIRYQNFKSKFGLLSKDNAPKGGQLDLDADVYAELGADKFVGVRASLMNQSFGNKGEGDAFHSLTNFKGNPYLKLEGSNWNVDLGVNVNAIFDIKTKVLFSPNIKADLRFYDVNVLYAEATGGVNNNTFLDILQENRYMTPANRVLYSKTLFDLKIGFKSGVVSGLEFDLFAGYKKTDQDHLFLQAKSDVWSNLSFPVYANVSTGHIGGSLKTNLIPRTDLSAKVMTYFYTVKYDHQTVISSEEILSEKKAWGRPTFTAEFNADIKPIDKLTLSLNYLYAGGRKTYDSSIDVKSSVKMKDINEFNVKGTYQITNWLSVFAKANNIFNQQYELQYGYPLQGFNALGGISLKF